MKYNTEENKKKYYSSYSLKLSDHLIDTGFVPFDKFKNLKTNNHCVVFCKSDKLQEVLTEWTNGSSNI